MSTNVYTCTLLGMAVLSCQKIEFGLYGIASHLSHLPEAKKDRRFANLTAEIFLSSDPEHAQLRKATLGQLTPVFGDRLLLSGSELEEFVHDRNHVMHNFWRDTRPLRGETAIPDPDAYLRDFIARAEKFTRTIQGLISHMQEAAAGKEGRFAELQITESDRENRAIYEQFAATQLLDRDPGDSSTLRRKDGDWHQ